MIKPTIHLNGTSARSLADSYSEAARCLDKAVEALVAASPNGRDYYPQGDDAIQQAIGEHSVRIAVLKAIYDEIAELYEHCEDHVRD